MVSKIAQAWMLVVLLFTSLSYASGAGGDLGVGVQFGEPIAATAKYYVDNKIALDFGFGYSWNRTYVGMVDMLYHGQYKSIRPYIGVGAQVLFSRHEYWHRHYYYGGHTHTAFGIRIPLGFEFKKDMFGFFMEVAPGIVFQSEMAAMVQGGVGVRFYFQ